MKFSVQFNYLVMNDKTGQRVASMECLGFFVATAMPRQGESVYLRIVGDDDEEPFVVERIGHTCLENGRLSHEIYLEDRVYDLQNRLDVGEKLEDEVKWLQESMIPRLRRYGFAQFHWTQMPL